MVRLLYTIGSALMNIAGLVTLGKQGVDFGRKVNKHNKPRYVRRNHNKGGRR